MTRALMTTLLLSALVVVAVGCTVVKAPGTTTQLPKQSMSLKDLAWAFTDLGSAAERAELAGGETVQPSARIDSPYGYRTDQAGRVTQDVLGALPKLPSPFEEKNKLYEPEKVVTHKPKLEYDPKTVAVPARPGMSDVESLLKGEDKMGTGDAKTAAE